ncbi:MAG: DUF420 domain-containing protein [Haloferacaceae archaeon]
MATASASGPAKDHPVAVTAVLSAVGYGLVVGTFAGVVPGAVFPDLTLEQVNILSDAIAVVNTCATLSLVAGWRWIRRGDVRKHAAAMSTAFVLILVFLVLYLTKIGGGGTKEFVGPTLVYYPYLAMLAIHIVLSIVAVPVVLYAIVLGVTRSPAELRQTSHARVGRVAAGTWVLSLSMGVLAYLLLNHVYGFEFVEATATILLPFA